MSAYSDAILKDGPVAYYRFGEASGTTAHDLSGNSNNATISGGGITYSQTGAIGGDSDTALSFNGSSGKVTLPGGASPVGWAAITLEAWVKLSSNSFGHPATLWATGTTPTNSGDGLKFWIGNNGVNGGFAVGVSGNKWAQATFSQTFTAGTYYHVAGVWDGHTITLYVNGVKNGSTGSVTGTIDSTGFPLTIGQDPQLGSDYFPGTYDEPAIYYQPLSGTKVQAHYAQGLGQVAIPAAPLGFILNPPGNVLLLINDVWYPTIRQESIHIERVANDPIPTFTFLLQDDPSHIPLTELMEVVFIDAGQVANPTHNLLSSPAMNPYTTNWTYMAHAGVTPSQNGGGGLVLTFANAASASSVVLSQTTQGGDITPGQTYMLSVYVQGGSTPTNIQATLQVNLLNAAKVLVANMSYSGPTPTNTVLTRYSLPVTVPPGVSYLQLQLIGTTTNATNSGTITFTQAQLEPMCFTSGNYQLSYPTPWCASGQLNCFVLPDGTAIRQLRLFGGLITKATAGAHVGANRQWTVTTSGYAWLLGKQILNDSWTAQNDSAIIADIVSKYFPNAFSTAQVTTVNEYQNTLSYAYNGYARDAFDTMASTSNDMYYADAYRTIWKQPPGYNTLPFELSDRPDFVTSFPYYNYTRDFDVTQIGNAIYVTGAQGIAATVFDAQSIATYAQIMNGGGVFWRTANDSALASTQAAIDRGIGEAIQFNYARAILHLSTNEFMIPGYTVLFTSVTDNLARASFLVQKATLVLFGFQSLFQAVYEFQCDLGAFNPNIINIHAKIMRKQLVDTTGGQAQKSTWGPTLPVTPSIDVMATETLNFRDSVAVTVTSSTPIGGIPTTWYGTAGATYGNNLVGYQ